MDLDDAALDIVLEAGQFGCIYHDPVLSGGLPDELHVDKLFQHLALYLGHECLGLRLRPVHSVLTCEGFHAQPHVHLQFIDRDVLAVHRRSHAALRGPVHLGQSGLDRRHSSTGLIGKAQSGRSIRFAGHLGLRRLSTHGGGRLRRECGCKGGCDGWLDRRLRSRRRPLRGWTAGNGGEEHNCDDAMAQSRDRFHAHPQR